MESNLLDRHISSVNIVREPNLICLFHGSALPKQLNYCAFYFPLFFQYLSSAIDFRRYLSQCKTPLPIRRFRKKPEVAWKRGLRALRSSRHLAVNINWINNRSRKSFKMEQVNIEDVKLTPEDIPGASFKDSEICKLTVNQLKFWLKCRRVNQGGNKKVLYERYMLKFKVKFILT